MPFTADLPSLTDDSRTHNRFILEPGFDNLAFRRQVFESSATNQLQFTLIDMDGDGVELGDPIDLDDEDDDWVLELVTLPDEDDLPRGLAYTLLVEIVDPSGDDIEAEVGVDDVEFLVTSSVPAAISLEISPAVAKPGEDFTLTATVTDADGEPVAGVLVTFENIDLCFGSWDDCLGDDSVVNEVETDTDGAATICFDPASVPGECTFGASIPGDATETVVEIAPASDFEIAVSTSLINFDPCEHRITATVTDTDGNPLFYGQVYVSTDLGEFDNGEGSRCRPVLSSDGQVSFTLELEDGGTPTLTVCFLPDDDDPCDEGEACTEHSVFLTCDEPPSLSAMFKLSGDDDELLRMLATGEGDEQLATLEDGLRVIIWDAFSWARVETIEEEAGEDWASVGDTRRTFAYADDSPVLGVCSNDFGLAIIDGDELATDDQPLEWADDDPGWPPEDTDLSPDGAYLYITAEDNGTSRLGVYDTVTMEIVRIIVEEDEADYEFLAVAVSNDGTRLAYTFRDRTGEDTAAMLGIRSIPSDVVAGTFLVLAEENISDLTVPPNGVCWSPDSELVAAANGSDDLEIYTRDGEKDKTISLALEGQAVAWSADGDFIAVHLESDGVAVMDYETGVEQVRLVGVDGKNPDYDTVAWRSDSQIVFATDRDSSEIHVFAPFDTTQPEIEILSPASGTRLEGEALLVEGIVSDDDSGFPLDPVSYSLDSGAQIAIEIEEDLSFSFEVDLDVGVHELHIRAVDLAGNPSPEVSLIVERLSPGRLVVSHDAITVDDGAIIDLGTVAQGEELLCEELVLRNVGGLSLDIDCPEFDTPFEAVCSGESLPGGAEETLTICLDSDVAGEFSQEVLIGPDELSVTVTGVVLAPFVRGDCNGNDWYEIGDAVSVLGVMFLGAESSCEDACDADGDGVHDIGDVTRILYNLFLDGQDPAAPFPDCDINPSVDSMGCESYEPCSR